MPYLRFIAMLTLPALLLGFSGLGCADVSAVNANAQARIEGKRIVQLVILTRVEQLKTVASLGHNQGKTPINWLSFTAPVIKTIWRIAAVLPVTHVARFAPSLTGIVVLQI